MSITTLADVKASLSVIHAYDDAKLQDLIDGAEAEALNYMDREQFGELCPDASSSETEWMPADVKTAVLLFVQAGYQAAPQEAEALIKVARMKLDPHRCRLGV